MSSKNDYITIEIVSMDGKPLESSSKILIQAGPLFRPTDWQDEPAEYMLGGDTVKGYKILNTGHMPWQGENIDGRNHLSNPNVTEAILLNTAGYEVHRIPLIKENDIIEFKLPKDNIYVVLQVGRRGKR